MLILVPRRKNLMIQDPELDDSADSTHHQICMLIASGREVEEDEQSEAFDPLGNPYVDPADLTKGTKKQICWSLAKRAGASFPSCMGQSRKVHKQHRTDDNASNAGGSNCISI
jgi:hypothetical protein